MQNRGTRVVGAYSSAELPVLPILSDYFVVTCVRLSLAVAVLTAITAGVALFVLMGNDHLTPNFTAFAICMLIICPLCAISSLCALKWQNGSAAVLYVATVGLAFASLLGLMIAYLVEPDDQNSLAGFFPRNVFLIVVQYTVILLLVALAFYCAMRLAELIRNNRLKDVLMPYKRDEDLESGGGKRESDVQSTACEPGNGAHHQRGPFNISDPDSDGLGM